MYPLSKLLAGGVLSAAALIGAAAPATAATPAPGSLATVQKVAAARIDARLRTLAVLRTAVVTASHLAAAHRSTLENVISSDTTGLTALRARMLAESTVDGVRADERSMVDDYRIYLLVVPKVRLTMALDAETAAIGTLTTVHNDLAAAIAAAQAKGTDVSTEQAELADLAGQQTAAQNTIAGKADALLAIAPSPDANALSAAVGAIRQSARTGAKDLHQASTDAKKIHHQLG